MGQREAALEFLRRFCAGDVDGLSSLLADDLRFAGPLYQFGSKAAFVDCLRADPPEKCDYRLLSVTEGGGCVSIYYEYAKAAKTITIAQLFKFKTDKISEILLVFDGRDAV